MTAIIQVENLVKRYKNSSDNAVDGISFDVQEGEFFTLLGENGAGKTTTISILTTTLRPTGGRALIAGHDVAEEASAVRQEIGIIFQQPSLDLNLTAEENVRFHAILYGIFPFRPLYNLMPRAYKQKVEELATILGISDSIFRPVKTFSGGMKRKLEIMRSLLHSPRLLLLDEPTTGLDPASRRDLWAYINKVRRESGTTVLLTTHYLEEAEGADTTCVLHKGKVVSYGTTADIKRDLVEEYLIIDTDRQHRPQLRQELALRGIPFLENGQFKVDIKSAEIHDFLKAVETPLTTIQPHTPTLEDAYMAIVSKDKEEK